MMRPDGRMPQSAARRGDTTEERTVRLPPVPESRDSRTGSWPTGALSPLVGRGHRTLRPIERPPRLRLVPSAVSSPAAPQMHRGRRMMLVVICIILGFTAAALVAEGVLIALGRPLL
jgi:hypothetical protein